MSDNFMSYWDNRIREPSPSNLEKIERMRHDGASINKIIEAARYTCVPITQGEFNNDEIGSYEGLRLKKISIPNTIEKVNAKNLLCEHITVGHSIKSDFSGSYFENVNWEYGAYYSDFSNTMFVDNYFTCSFFNSIFFNSEMISWRPKTSLDFFDCNMEQFKTFVDLPRKIHSKDFIVRKKSPDEHYRCDDANESYWKRDTNRLKKFRLQLSDEIIDAEILFSHSEIKSSLVFPDNLQFGDDESNFVNRDCFYNVETKHRKDFENAAREGGVLDIRDKGVALRFVRPIF